MEFKKSIDEQQIFNTLRDLIKFRSVKYDGKECGEYVALPDEPFGHEIAQALEYMLALCESIGMRVKNCNGKVGYAEVGEGDEMVAVLVHLDVVPEGNGWTYPPYAGEIHDGRIYGRGAIDDKGPAVAAVFAVKALLDSGFKFSRRVRLIFGTDEENDWEDMAYYTEHEEHPTFGFAPDADFPLIYGEMGILQLDFVSTIDPDDKSFICGGEAANAVADYCEAHIQKKDGGFMDVKAEGVSAHASTPEKGSNAISKAMKELYAEDVRQQYACSEAMLKLIEFYNNKIGFCLHGEKIGCDLCDEETGRLTFNVGKISTEAGSIMLSIDIRCPATIDEGIIIQRLEKEAAAYGIKLTNIDFMKPVFSDCDSFLVKTLLKVYREETGDLSRPLTMGGGTYARAMDNTVAFGPLFPEREATEHTSNEYILTEDLIKITEIYAKAIEGLCCTQ